MDDFKSCVVLICITGGIRVQSAGEAYPLAAGETMLLPASLDDLMLIPDTPGTHLLQVHLPQPPKEDVYDGPEPE
jgi:hypothetical protein